MLSKLSLDIAECYQHAEGCAWQAEREPDPDLQEDFLQVERRWLALARSYELAERIERFQYRRRR